jgi:DNA-binding CsgD family transcriptional regulator
VNAWHIIWRDLKTWMHRKRVFAVDVESYETLRLVAEREKRSPQEVASQLFEQAAYEQSAQSWATRCWEQLSPRQKQVTAYVCRGDSTRQIAAQLNIAPSTVKSHIEIILYKFRVTNRVALRQLLAPWNLSSYL